MSRHTPTTLALDLGNSTLAVGIFAGEQLVTHVTLPVAKHSPQALAAKVAKLVNARPRTADAPPTEARRNQSSHSRLLWTDAAATTPRTIKGPLALCSVVPALTEPLCDALESALGTRPRLLTPRARHGLKLNYRRPAQLGADRLAAALGARKLYPQQNLIVVDCGTATTLTFISRDGVLLGGAILPGLGLWADALARATAQLPKVTLPKTAHSAARSPQTARTVAKVRAHAPAQPQPLPAVATDTAGAIRAGLLYGHAGAIRALVQRGSRDAFGPRDANAQPIVIGTGGQAPLLAAESDFTVSEPALTLHGLQAFAASH
ncbi:hypothetical protein AXK11_01290 [Cephaloticoccus primus]|uniref:Type III pantothenate kinase n=1 Tax=Cephaloticoccus primus TaxID=1548207 RepID=A0A139SUJ0_9BACT|nr:type III pantothenate kinase [Cephaloticoccus primus]KXU38100.1 hypothetical protein AXK11_01290 [Cephaloticoccus primus]